MSEAYLKEMLQYRKTNDSTSIVKCRRRRIANKGVYVPEKVRDLTREQAKDELEQLRRRFVWDEDISPRQLSDRLKILEGCGYYSVSHKAALLSKFLPLRAGLIKVRLDGDLHEDLWEMLCLSLIDQRSYILNADFWGRLDGKTIRIWKQELQEFRSKSSELAMACGSTLEEIEDKLKEISYLTGSAKAGKDDQPVMSRLIERDARRTRVAGNTTTESFNPSGKWQFVLIGIFVLSGLFRGFMRENHGSHHDQLRHNLDFAAAQAKLNEEKIRQLSKSGNVVFPWDPNWADALSKAKNSANYRGVPVQQPASEEAPRLQHATPEQLHEAMQKSLDQSMPVLIAPPFKTEPLPSDDDQEKTQPQSSAPISEPQDSNQPAAEVPINP